MAEGNQRAAGISGGMRRVLPETTMSSHDRRRTTNNMVPGQKANSYGQ